MEITKVIWLNLSVNCKERLQEIRYITQNSGILDTLVTPLSDRKYAIFPWIGTRQLVTLHYALLKWGMKIDAPLLAAGLLTCTVCPCGQSADRGKIQ